MLKGDFRSEVYMNIHPALMEEIARVNEEEVDAGYGLDGYGKRATGLMQQYFSEEIYTCFALNGTAANILALKGMLDRYSTVICAEQTHINTYEAGALEYNLGNKILAIPSVDGKITPLQVASLLDEIKNYEYQPKVIVVTQPTECGTVYTNKELKDLCDYAHSVGLYMYLDGARIGNGVVALNTNLTEMIEKTGIDAFTFGGTKAGAMMGEMIVFRRKCFANALKYSQKQSLQHISKSKFLSAQIAKILETGLWIENAKIGNEKAKLLEKRFIEKGVKIAYKVQSNMVFAIIPPALFSKISKIYDIHYWEEKKNIVRFTTTYFTTNKQIEALAKLL